MVFDAVDLKGEHKSLHGLIETDDVEECFIRYTWIQHETDNERYVTNYFTGGVEKGLNIRAQSVHLNSYWEGFNTFMDLAIDLGYIAWRVKVFNEINRSIDYIEVWRNKQAIHNLYDFRQDIVLENGYVWKKESKLSLSQGIDDVGFKKWNLASIRGISEKMAADQYKNFVAMWRKKQNCIINTPYFKKL